MLRVWKRSWKEKDPPPDSRQSALDGHGSGASSLDSTAASHPSNAPLVEARSFGESVLKRHHTDVSTSQEPLRKRARFDSPLPVTDRNPNVFSHARALGTSGCAIDEPQSRLRTEVVVLYEKAKTETANTLLNEFLPLKIPDDRFLLHMKDSQAALSEGGVCASDLVWRQVLKEIEASDGTSTGVQCPSSRDQLRNRIKNWIFPLPNLDPTSSCFNVSHKFFMLVKALESCQPYGDAFRGIILVKRRAVALAVTDMLRMLDNPSIFFRPLHVVWDDISPTERQVISHSFTTGVYNILIMPKLHKDLQTSKTSAVISFNSECLDFRDDLGLIQTIIHLVQNDNIPTERARSSPDRMLEPLPIEDIGNMCSSTSIQDPTTGSCLGVGDCVTVVDRIASIGQLNGMKINRILYSYDNIEDASGSEQIFSCTLSVSGLTQLTGPSRKTKSDAKSAVCFIFCQHLASIGLLDCSFFPPPKKCNITGMEQSPQGTNSGRPRSYSRKEPDFWLNTKSINVTCLYPIIISIHSDEKQSYAPLVIFTRQPLPDLSSFNIFHSGIPSPVSFMRGAPVLIEEMHLKDLYLYTLRVCRAVSNKPFECLPADMAYFLAPLAMAQISHSNSTSQFNLPTITKDIPWDLVKLAGNDHNAPLRLDDAEKIMHDVVVQDRSVELTRRYDAVKLRPDLSPLSKPKDSPREAAFASILDYTKARRRGFTDLQDMNQPLIEVVTMPAVTNQLNPLSRPMQTSKSPPAKYLIPELCSKSTLPASVFRTALLLPSITRRIDEFLLVKELNARLFDHKISDILLHMSLCTPSCGVEYNYERLELLGDAFLKFLSSTYLFVTRPAFKEGSLHDARQDLISNKALYLCASSVGIPHYIQSKLFSARLWAPPFFAPLTPIPLNKTNDSGQAEAEQGDVKQTTKKKKKKKRKRTSDESIQWLADKAVADVAEAILAAGYLTSGLETGLQVAKGLGIPIHSINTWSDFSAKDVDVPLNLHLKQDTINEVGRIIGYKIKKPLLLSQALTHSSVPGHDSTFTERLEFVGDAILDFTVIRHLYDREKQLTPGGLSLLKSAMVSNSALAAVCVSSGLHEHFINRSPPLQTSIREYAAKLEMCRKKEYRDAESEGRAPGQYWLEIAAPKALSDILESIIGAIYVADQFSLEGIEALYTKLLKPFYDKHITLKTLSHHPTTLLFELFQSQGCKRLAIQNEKGKLPMTQVTVHGITLARAEDQDPTLAARRASLFALDALEGDPGFFGRTCDCRIPQIRQPVTSNKPRSENENGPHESDEEDVGGNGCPPVENMEESEIEEGMIVE